MGEEKINQDAMKLDAEKLDEVAGGSNANWTDPLNLAKDYDIKKCPKCGFENRILKSLSSDQRVSCRKCAYRGAKNNYL